MIPIGAFAKENNVTIRALHHYEQLGLIIPNNTDEFTGYRYYDESQSSAIMTINYLKSLGFSLSEVKQMMSSEMDASVLKQHLYAKKQQALMDVNSTNIRYNRIVELLNVLDKQTQNMKIDLKEIINMDNNDIKIEMNEHELFNFEARIMYERANKNNLPLCILCVDIDQFKRVNDNYGYDIGDIVIERIKNSIADNLTEINKNNNKQHSIMERDAGDEFKMIVADAMDVCRKLARSIIDDVKEIDFNDVADELHMTVTVGIASIDSCRGSSSHLFHLAESALYEAKSEKRGSYEVYQE